MGRTGLDRLPELDRRALASYSHGMVGKMYSSAFSTVERAGKGNLNEGPKVSYDVVSERGKLAARQSASRLALGCD